MFKRNKLFFAILFGYAASTQANIVDFSGNICSASADGTGALTTCSDFPYINQSYGDSGNVNVTYKDLINTGNSLSWWDTDYNNLVGVAWGGNGDGTGQSWDRIEIAPVGNYTITLNSFDMGAYFQTQRNTNIQVLDLLTNSVLLGYGTQTVGTGNTATNFAPNISSADGIAIEWKDSAYNVGIDNINFSVNPTVSVPEPATFSLMGLGLAGMGWKLRRKVSA